MQRSNRLYTDSTRLNGVCVSQSLALYKLIAEYIRWLDVCNGDEYTEKG